jgi:hypothetical protein
MVDTYLNRIYDLGLDTNCGGSCRNHFFDSVQLFVPLEQKEKEDRGFAVFYVRSQSFLFVIFISPREKYLRNLKAAAYRDVDNGSSIKQGDADAGRFEPVLFYLFWLKIV